MTPSEKYRALSDSKITAGRAATGFTSSTAHLAELKARSGVTYDSAARLLRFGATADDVGVGVAAARLTLRTGPANEQSRAAMAAARRAMPAATAQKMADYHPELPTEQVTVIRSFVEDAVALTLPQTSYSVETLLSSSMHFIYWAVFVVGAELNAGIVFNRELIEHYVRDNLPGLE